MVRFPLNQIVNRRSCGECQACCEVLGIKELEKPPRKKCSHQCSIGCNIYESRPETCRGYACLWQLGILDGDERRRPDKLGVIFDFRAEGTERVRKEDTKMIQAWEVWPGAFKDPSVDWIIRRMADRFPLVLQRDQ